MKTPSAMTERTTMTSFLDTTTNLWADAFLVGRVGDFDDDDDSNNDHKDDNENDNSERGQRQRHQRQGQRRPHFFDTTTNLWADAFLAGRGG